MRILVPPSADLGLSEGESTVVSSSLIDGSLALSGVNAGLEVIICIKNECGASTGVKILYDLPERFGSGIRLGGSS